jgi:Tfp pilus assembly protein PilN
MIYINLIAERRKLQLRRMRLLRAGVYGVGVMAVGTVLLWVGIGAAISGFEGQLAECNAKLTAPQLARSLERIKFLEQQQELLAPRMELLEKVQDSQRAWISIMRDVSACMPPSVWLTSITSRRNPDAQMVEVSGSATSQRSVADFMLNLKSAAWCKPPDLNYTQTVKQNMLDQVNFQISIPLRNPIGSNLQ